MSTNRDIKILWFSSACRARIMDEDNHLSDIRSAALGGDVSHKLTAESVPALYKCFDAVSIIQALQNTKESSFKNV